MEPQVRFCTSADGTQIAYATVGSGLPLVTTPWSWQSLGHELDDEYGGPFYEALARRCMVVVYDRRGVGLSDRERTDFTVEADVSDLEAVVDHIGLKRFALMGNFHLGPAAIAYASRHAQKVSRLILYGTYAHGRDLTQDEIKTSITSMMRTHWGMASRTLADITAPGAEGDVLERIAHIYRESATGDMAASLLEMAYSTDVSELLPKIEIPTLVLHRHQTRTVPFRLSRELTSVLPNAQLRTLEGTLYWPWLGDSDSVVTSIFDFLGIEPESEIVPTVAQSLPSSGTAIILFADIVDSTALTERMGDAAFRKKARELDEMLRSIIRNADGTPVEGKLLGDGVLSVFTSAKDAIDAALRFGEAGESVGLGLHVGMHAGDVIQEDGNVFGGAVNIAARISGESAAGEVLVSDTVRSLARTSAGVSFEDRGEHELKGIDEPQRLFAVKAGN